MHNLIHPSEEMLNEYLDDVMEAGQRAELEAHLAGCSACAARLEELNEVFVALQNLPELSLGRDLAPSILARVPRGWQRRHRAETPAALGWLFGLQIVLAVALLLASWSLVAQEALAWELPELDEQAWAKVEQVVQGWAEEGQIAWQSVLDWPSSWQSDWKSTWQSTQLAVEQGTAAWQQWTVQAESWQLPQIDLVTLLMAAILAWMAANGWLLQSNRLGDSLGRNSLFHRRRKS
ncbi:MAG: zf-HC2 domain-containing protein [Chloroflexota bacterium]